MSGLACAPSRLILGLNDWPNTPGNFIGVNNNQGKRKGTYFEAGEIERGVERSIPSEIHSTQKTPIERNHEKEQNHFAVKKSGTNPNFF